MPHWRQNHESSSNHLKSVDLFDERRSSPDRPAYYSPVVEIESVSKDRLKSREKPKGEMRNFIHLKGKKKPLGLNVTNCEALETISGSPDPQHWVGLKIKLYVDLHAKYPKGKTGPAIRIYPKRLDDKAQADTSPLPELTPDTRDRLEEEHHERIEGPDEREPGEEG